MTEIDKELARFEKTFKCKDFLKGRIRGAGIVFARVFYKAMSIEGYTSGDIMRSVGKNYINICYHLRNVTPIETLVAKEFVENPNYEYKGLLGVYND